MCAQKEKPIAEQGASAPPVDALKIEATEYPKDLALVYRDASLPSKPRNVLGIAKDLPAAEMGALLASYPADEEALRALANRRALAVKEWFVDAGGIASERVFVVAAKLNGDGIADKARRRGSTSQFASAVAIRSANGRCR